MKRLTSLLMTIVAIIMIVECRSQAAPPPPAPPITSGAQGKLIYSTDERGNRVSDFSFCGYQGGDAAIPNVPIRAVVPPIDGDSTARIQRAIDYVSSLPPDQRGAVLLQKGRYEILGGLRISASGVVLRGSGAGDGGTILIATGLDRRTLITIAGKDDRVIQPAPIAIADRYTPVNAKQIKLAQAPAKWKTGDSILIRRASSAEWIKLLGMDSMGGDRHGFTWKPGSRDLFWDRTITAIEGDSITFDAPITNSIDAELGGGDVTTYSWPGRIAQVGVENLRCESAFDAANPKDEAHAWFAITMENAQDAWVRQVTAAHFVGGAVAVWESCKRVTVEDCKSLDPISEIAGSRRNTFFTAGQQTLFQRCYSERGMHDYSVGFCAAGPNAFVQCDTLNALDDSGPVDSWASGVLYDNVRINGNALNLFNRRFDSQGAGWSAANCMLWQCNAAVINCFSPPGATNYAIGCWGAFAGDGIFQSSRESVRPVSLYYAQLADRIGPKAMDRADIMAIPSDASSSPTIEEAAKLTAASTKPGPQLSLWIDEASKRNPIPIDPAGAKTIDSIPPVVAAQPPRLEPIKLDNGLLTIGGKAATGGVQGIKWWAGGVRPFDIAKAEPSPTRFVPGRYGWGLTDDLNQVTDEMVRQNRIAMNYNYGLWYDTRDADHERVRRMDGDVWPPFYELPFARSGKELAWDGLSKYDLTKYNPWYFARLKELAGQCDQKGLVLLHQQFFQHNILEAGAHWASVPWRTVNNINDTGFPEPPPYAGDKRIFMAEQFYDVSNPVRRAIYRAYIRKCLDNFAENHNVIQLTSAEFTGPLHFVQFWLDTIAEWQKETGRDALIGLSATKDVQDAILADPARAAIVDVIDIRYWWYQEDGTLYAPPGGKNLSPRQFERIIKHKGSSSAQAARAVSEYRKQFPGKAVIYSADGADRFGDAVFKAGGSLAQVKR